MTEASEQNAEPPQAEWYYAADGRQVGPVSQEQLTAWLKAGQISPHMPLWREGMPQWLPASQIEQLKGVAGGPPPLTSPVPGVTPEEKKVKNAKHNCITMFVVFALFSLLFVASALSRLGAIGAGASYGGMGCMGCAALAGGIFAAIYLPLRWRIIMQLPNPYRALGLIGGFGLIASLLLVMVGVIVPMLA